jgi:glycosyltransferase involved in cell wall biosynthesis
MKLSLFFDGYKPYLEFKDPGQIILGLLEVGINTDLLAVTKTDLVNYVPPFSIVENNWNQFNSKQFWLENDSDIILAYTWLSASYTPLIEKIKSIGKKVLIKSDSDGRIGYPLPPSYLRAPIFEEATLKNLLRHVWWRMPFKSLHLKRAAQRIRQIELSDGVIIESPDALSNLNYFLTKWGRRDLIKKTHFIPNPVTPEFINSKIDKKENIVVSVGRWDDPAPKNTKMMVEVVTEFLKNRYDYTSTIIGTGEEKVESLIEGVPKNIRDRIKITGFVEHDKIKDFLLNAKMLFIPSRWESFSVAACEALCMGCSIVGTPIESLRYLSMQGFSGTIASTFKKEAILAALIQDSMKWDYDYYQPDEIADFWRGKVDRKSVAEQIANLACTL